ncbi:MAG: LapA family protein [Myxococcales bacterium]|nr:LapA family protein [Myxococcales bacterium]
MFRTFTLICVLVGAFSLALFWVQNSSRTTQISFDIGFAAWQLQKPVSVPALATSCFGAGFVIGFGIMMVRNARLSSQIRQLEHELDLTSRSDTSSW